MLSSMMAFSQDKPEEKSKEKSEEKKEEKATVASKTKSCKMTDGLFPIYQDTAKGNIFMAISKEQLDKEFIHFFHAENGGLNYGWVKGSFGQDQEAF